MKKIISLLKYIIPTTLLVLMLSFLIVTTTQAGTLSAVYVFLSRLKINLNGTGTQAVEMILAIDTSTAVASGSTIKIEFPDAEDTNGAEVLVHPFLVCCKLCSWTSSSKLVNRCSTSQQVVHFK